MMRSIYTQFWPPKPRFTDADVPAQTGKVFMVTGGNAGVGFELCRLLYGTGATVYMAARNKDKAEAAIKTIIAEATGPAAPKSSGGALKFLHLDLADLSLVRKAAKVFAEAETQLDVLYLNAGMGGNSLAHGARTPQGLEMFMFVHCLAHLLLAQLLHSQLRRASSPGSPSRVVWTSSGLTEMGSPPGGVDFDLLGGNIGINNKDAPSPPPSSSVEKKGDSITAYSASKAGNWFLAYEMARRWSGDGILAVCQTPGNLKTASYEGTGRVLMAILNLLVLQHPRYGAYTGLFAGLSPEVTMQNNGCYIYPWGRIVDWDRDVPHRRDIVEAMRSEEEGGKGGARRLWEWCEANFDEAST